MALFIMSVSRFQHMSLTDVTYRCDNKLTSSFSLLSPATVESTARHAWYQRNAGAGVRFLTCRQSWAIVDPRIYTILATDGCPEQFRTVRRIHHRPKSKDTGCAFSGLPILDCLQKMTVQHRQKTARTEWRTNHSPQHPKQ